MLPWASWEKKKKKNRVRLISDSSPFIYLCYSWVSYWSHTGVLAQRLPLFLGMGLWLPTSGGWVSHLGCRTSTRYSSKHANTFQRPGVWPQSVWKAMNPCSSQSITWASVSADQSAVYTSPALGPLGSGASTKLLKMVLLSPNKTLLASLLLQRVHLCN